MRIVFLILPPYPALLGKVIWSETPFLYLYISEAELPLILHYEAELRNESKTQFLFH